MRHLRFGNGGFRNAVHRHKPGKLIIAADGDEPGREAAQTLARSAHALGCCSIGFASN